MADPGDAMTAHNARAMRRQRGWMLWYSACSCGWQVNAVSREDAEERAKGHARDAAHAATPPLEVALAAIQRLTCQCWHYASGELDPTGPCDRCVALEALKQVAA